MRNHYSNLRQKLTNVERKIFGDYLASEINPKKIAGTLTLGTFLLTAPGCTLNIPNPIESVQNYGSAKTDTRKLKEGTTTHKIPSYTIDMVRAYKGTGKDAKKDTYIAKELPKNKTVVIAGRKLDRSLILEGTYLFPEMNHDETITSNGVETKSDEMYALVNVTKGKEEGIPKVNNCNTLEDTIILYDRGNLKIKTKDKGKKFVVQKRSSSVKKKLPQLMIGKNKNKYDITKTDDGIEGNLSRLQIMILDNQGNKKDGYITRVSIREGKRRTSHLKKGIQYVPVRIDGFTDYKVEEPNSVDEGNARTINDINANLEAIPEPIKEKECGEDFVDTKIPLKKASKVIKKKPEKKIECPGFTVMNNSVIATPNLSISCIKVGIEGYGNYNFNEFVNAFKEINENNKFINGNKDKLKVGETYTLPLLKEDCNC